MQKFLSVSPVYDSPSMTWTVYWTLIQPALLFDYPEYIQYILYIGFTLMSLMPFWLSPLVMYNYINESFGCD